MKFTTVVLILLVAAAGGWAYYFGPYYVDYFKMQDVTASAALNWTAYSEAHAREELRTEMKRRNVGEYLTPEVCTFFEDVGETKVVDCEWYVDVYLPGDKGRRLEFSVVYAAEPGATRATRR